MLRTIVTTCHAVLHERDIIGRLGGEEFACILPDTSPEQSKLVAEKLRAAVDGVAVGLPGGQSCSVTVSVGISNMTALDADIEVVLGRADAALYEAKQAGRNCVRQHG